MNVFEILISVLFFTAIVGTVATSIAGTLNPFNTTSNITGGSAVLMGLLTLVIIAGFVVYLAKKTGVMKGR